MKLLIASDLHGSAFYMTELLRSIDREQPDKVLLLGDGSEVYRKKLASGLTVPFVFQVPQMRAQSAAAVAVCALKYLREGKACTADSFVPDYMSLSQAERERNARLKGAANESVSG